MGKIVEEKGIPIPSNISKAPRNEYVKVLENTAFGDSFSIMLDEGENMKTVQSKIRQTAKRRGIKIVANQVSESQLRVWCIGNEPKKAGSV